MSTLNKVDFDKHLQNEFSRLGFNYLDIKANGIKVVDKYRSSMYAVDYLDSPFMLADGLAIVFTVVNPIIESINATLFNDSCYENFTALVEKTYSIDKGGIPTKDQILSEMKEMLKIKNVREKFGFEANSQNQEVNQKNTTYKKRF